MLSQYTLVLFVISSRVVSRMCDRVTDSSDDGKCLTAVFDLSSEERFDITDAISYF